MNNKTIIEFGFRLRAADWPTTNFQGMYCYFSVIQLVNFVQVAQVKVVALQQTDLLAA